MVSISAWNWFDKRTSPARIIRLIRLLRQLKPNVNHTSIYHADLLGGPPLRLAGVRSVALDVMGGIVHQVIELFQRSADQKSRLGILALERVGYEELYMQLAKST